MIIIDEEAGCVRVQETWAPVSCSKVRELAQQSAACFCGHGQESEEFRGEPNLTRYPTAVKRQRGMKREAKGMRIFKRHCWRDRKVRRDSLEQPPQLSLQNHC
jgi:hypothetical protein